MWPEKIARPTRTLVPINGHLREAIATLADAKNGVHRARKKTKPFQRGLENALNRVPGTGNDTDAAASRANAPKYMMTKTNNTCARRLAQNKFRGSEFRLASIALPLPLYSGVSGIDGSSYLASSRASRRVKYFSNTSLPIEGSKLSVFRASDCCACTKTAVVALMFR